MLNCITKKIRKSESHRPLSDTFEVELEALCAYRDMLLMREDNTQEDNLKLVKITIAIDALFDRQ